MAPALEIRRGRRRVVYQILEDRLTIGSGPDDHVRVGGDDVEPGHLLVRVARNGIVQLDVVGGDGRVILNGVYCAMRRLANRDTIELGDAEIEFVADDAPADPAPRAADAVKPKPATKPAPAARPRAADVAASAEVVVESIPSKPAARSRPSGGGQIRARSARRASSSGPQWAMMSTVFAVVVLAAILLIRWAQTAEFGKDPAALVTLAENHYQQRKIEEAIATLDAAAEAEPDRDVLARIEELRSRIERTLAKQGDQRDLAAARTEFNNIASYESLHLKGTPTRAASREMVRQLRAWSERYREVCARWDETKNMVASVDERLTRFLPIAAMSEPDTADDVLFSATRRTRFRPRRYREALGILDQWLLQNPTTDGADRVRDQRRQWVDEGREWAKSRLSMIESLVRQGSFGAALDELEFLDEKGAMPDWIPDLPQRRAAIQAQMGDG